MPPHDNGLDPEERDEAARAHADFDRIPRAEAMRMAFVEARMAKDGFRRASSDMLGGLGALTGEVSSLHNKFDLLSAKVEDGFERLGQNVGELAERLGNVEHRHDESRRELDSVADAIESISDDRLRHRVSARVSADSRARTEAEARLEDVERELANAREERRTEAIRAKVIAEEADKRDKAAAKAVEDSDKREERWKRRFGLALAACALISVIGGAVLWTWSQAEKHPPPASLTPAK